MMSVLSRREKGVSWMKINHESVETAIEVQKRQGQELIWELGQPVPLRVV